MGYMAKAPTEEDKDHSIAELESELADAKHKCIALQILLDDDWERISNMLAANARLREYLERLEWSVNTWTTCVDAPILVHTCPA